MKIVDKYIGSRFLATFGLILILFAAVIVVIDITEKTDEFIDKEVPFKDAFVYFLNFLPQMISMLAPLFFFIAVIFFTSRLAYRSEIIALTSGGISFYRFLLPYVGVALLVSGFFFVNNHYFLPNAIKEVHKFENLYTNSENVKTQILDLHIQNRAEEMVYVRTYNVPNKTGYNFQYERFVGNDVVYKLKARSLEFIDSTKTWLARDFKERIIDAEDETFNTGLEMPVDLNLGPDDFALIKDARESMTTPQLNKQIKREEAKGSEVARYFKVEKHRRTATPISIIILTLIGVSIASRKVRGGVGLHLAYGFLISALFVFSIKFSETLAENASVPSAIMVWIPNIIFGLVAVYLILKAQK